MPPKAAATKKSPDEAPAKREVGAARDTGKRLDRIEEALIRHGVLPEPEQEAK